MLYTVYVIFILRFYRLNNRTRSTCIWSLYLSVDTCGSYYNFLDRVLLLTRKILNQGLLLVKLKSSLWKFYGRNHDLVDRYGITVSNDHGYVTFVVNTSRFFPHSWLITGFVTRLTRRVSLVEWELLALREYLSSHPSFSWVRVTRSLFYMYVLLIVGCPFALFVLAIALSVLSWFTNFD